VKFNQVSIRLTATKLERMVSYQNSDHGKHGGVVRGYVACDLGVAAHAG
jgi:hypothetical protein